MLFTTQIASPASEEELPSVPSVPSAIPPIELDEEKYAPEELEELEAPLNLVPEKELTEYKFGNKNVKNVMNTSADLLKWGALKNPDNFANPIPIKDFPKNALLWLSLIAYFPIPDIPESPKIYTNPSSNTPPLIDNYSSIIQTYLGKATASTSRLYPTMEHYLLAMKIKFASDSPAICTALMSYSSKKFYQPLAAILASIDEYSNEYFKKYIENSKLIRKAMRTENLLKLKIKVYDNVWNQVKQMFIEFAFNYRLKHDAIFRNIIASLHKENDTYNYVYSPKNSVDVLTPEERMFNDIIIDKLKTPVNASNP